MIQIWHNTRCSKSRECLAFLDDRKTKYEVVEYLKTPPTIEELKILIQKLGIKPIELVRKKEPLWLEKYAGKKLSNAQIINALVKNPILIERPIIVNGDKAIIARPIENAAGMI